MELGFYVEDLARRWLSVSVAAATDKDRPALYKTVCVEVFEGRGARLTSTDSYLLLTTWVPLVDERGSEPPTLDEAPDVTVVAIDPDYRAAGLLRYALQLDARDEEAAPLELKLGVGIVHEADAGTFEGMEPRWVTLEVPSMERVQLPIYEGAYPSWRVIESAFTAQRTTGVALNPEILGRLGPLAKYWPLAALLWHFGGEEKLARLELDVVPPIDGLVMPIRHEAFGVDEDEDTSEELDDSALVRLAAEISIVTGYGSVATIQRKAHVTYVTASRALDLLQELGIVGEAIGSKARPLLVDEARAIEILTARFPLPDEEADS
jgi:hypothetical protein